MNYPVELRVGEKVYPVEYKKVLKTRSTVRFSGKKVVLKLSRFLVGREKDETVEHFLKWAVKKLSKVEGVIEPNYVDGGRICTHNKDYIVRVVVEDRVSARSRLKDGVIELFLPFGDEDRIQDLCEKAIMKDQIAYLGEVLNELNQLYFQEELRGFRFKRISSRFGSCSVKRNINIAYRLLFAPREVFRYVCVHELAHLKEMNHSSRFWALVEEAMPEYKDHEGWLKMSGFMLG